MSAPLLSVVIPTYNEEANIGPLLRALKDALVGIPYEAIVVDDASKDATATSARGEGAHVIVRRDERGLATAVVRGLREARGVYVAVMDADFQHPPEAVRGLLDKALADNADVVVGSRYAQGGSEGNFGPLRRTISWGAGLLGKLALPPIRKFGITDPMSGLFLVRRAAVDCDTLRPHGYKILLEILGRCPLERVSEVGYTFQDRRGGESKLGAGVIVQYAKHVAVLGKDHPENRRAAKFSLVGLSGVVVNLGLFSLFLWLFGIEEGRDHLAEFVALAVAIEASILSNFLLNDRFTFHDRRHDHVLERLAKFNAVSLLALVVNLSAYAILTRGFGLPAIPSEAVAIVVAFGANYLGNLHWTYGGVDGFSSRDFARKAAPWLPFLLLTGAATAVYFEDIDRVGEIYFDEHYYVSVGRQIDNGIWEDPCWVGDGELDHRPLNYEHPPLAKYLIAWSIMRFDTDHAVFEGCRSPDDTNAFPCDVVEHGQVVASTENRKACYDAYTQRAKEHGNPVAWRLPSALLGVTTVLFIALAAQRLFGRRAEDPAATRGPWPGWLATTLPAASGATFLLLGLVRAEWLFVLLGIGQVAFAAFAWQDARARWVVYALAILALVSVFLYLEGGALEVPQSWTFSLAVWKMTFVLPPVWSFEVLLFVANLLQLFPFLPDPRGWFAGVLAGSLVLMDPLVYTSARLAILDIFAAGFLAVAVYGATLPSKKGVLLTAAFLGLAFSCKYSVVFAGPAVALLSLWTQRRAGLLTRRRFDFNLAAFALVPLVIWVAMYLPWWMLWVPDMGLTGAVEHWAHVQGAAFKWGATGYQEHDYASQPEAWLSLEKPTFYYHVWGFGDGKEGWVFAVGNPLLWWSFSVAAITAVTTVAGSWLHARWTTRKSGMAAMAPPAEPLAAPRPRPREATAAVAALVASSLLMVAGAAYLTFTFLAGSLPALSTYVVRLVFIGSLLSAAMGVIGLLLAIPLARGEAWARTLTLALAILRLGLGAWGVSQGSASWGSWAFLALDLAIIALLLHPESRTWFEHRSFHPLPGSVSPLAYFAAQPRDVQASFLASVLAISAYGLFFLVDRVTFLFYMTLIVPLGCLALAGVLHLMWGRSWSDRFIVAIVVVGIVAACLFYLPVASGERISCAQFRDIMDRVPWMAEGQTCAGS